MECRFCVFGDKRYVRNWTRSFTLSSDNPWSTTGLAGWDDLDNAHDIGTLSAGSTKRDLELCCEGLHRLE